MRHVKDVTICGQKHSVYLAMPGEACPDGNLDVDDKGALDEDHNRIFIRDLCEDQNRDTEMHEELHALIINSGLRVWLETVKNGMRKEENATDLEEEWVRVMCPHLRMMLISAGWRPPE